MFDADDVDEAKRMLPIYKRAVDLLETVSGKKTEQAEQEPVAYMFKVKRTLPSSTSLDVFAAIEYHPLPHEDIISKEPLYTAPVRTKDLTGQDLCDLEIAVGWKGDSHDFDVFARAVIAADREKNK